MISADDRSISVAKAALGGQVQTLHHLFESEFFLFVRAFYEPGCLMSWNTGPFGSM